MEIAKKKNTIVPIQHKHVIFNAVQTRTRDAKWFS